MDMFADLTPAQREAVAHVDGPLLVLAAAGSGKTRVITRRVAHLLQQGISGHEILALTFTNKAAGEMRERIEALAPKAGVWVGTFHALCARLLRRYAPLVGLDRNFTIYDQGDRLRAVKQVMERLGLDDLGVPPERVDAAISRAKNDLASPETLARRGDGDHVAAVVARVYQAYQDRLRESSAVDFDDLLVHLVTIVKTHKDVRKELDARFRYVLVDEYQDTNLAQYAIVRALSIDHPNLCVTGDPDQSIYGWRGANLSNILDFEQDYPGCKVVRLEQNYRSTKNILRVADHLIQFNKRRKPKALTTENPDGPPVELTTYTTE
ncbi:MAG: UvrD-helicase domain-containing protein, partial [Isosphaeraceae bacterium]